MWNYAEVDKYPTLEEFNKLIPLIHDAFPEHRDYMIKSILNDGPNQFVIEFTVAQNGFNPTVRLTDGKLEIINKGEFWMS